MSITVVIGTQWGDEGKGKFTHILSKQADIIVRYQGGNNAGHTIFIGDKKFVFHLLPSGIIEDGKVCVLGNGLVVDPIALTNEITVLEKQGYKITNKLLVSENAHIVLLYHKLIEEFREVSKVKIGTTKKGIGPAYEDKYARIGIRVIDYIDDNLFLKLLNLNIAEKRNIINKFTTTRKLKKRILKEREKIIEKFKKFVTNTILFLNKAEKEGKNILLEGAQGIMLDVDFGSYPYVTSSNPSVGGIGIGTGLPPTKIDKILGITKAYTTRVGKGPFPTELHNKTGELLRKYGNEFGATTGRPRRCGWLDLVVVKSSILINDITSLVLTKLDILSYFKEIEVCTGYKYKNQIFHYYPMDRSIIKKVKPIYKTFKGWEQDVSEIKEYKRLPVQLRDFVKFIQDETEIPVDIISVGKEKRRTIYRK